MADNTRVPVATVGDDIATDDVAGVKHQRVKVEFGADGSATDVSPVNPLPVTVDSGTLMNRIELLELTLRQLLAGAAGQVPDYLGRARVTVDNMASGLSLSTIATVTNVATVAKLTGLGIYPAEQVLLNNPAALALRDRIQVT